MLWIGFQFEEALEFQSLVCRKRWVNRAGAVNMAHYTHVSILGLQEAVGKYPTTVMRKLMTREFQSLVCRKRWVNCRSRRAHQDSPQFQSLVCRKRWVNMRRLSCFRMACKFQSLVCRKRWVNS